MKSVVRWSVHHAPAMNFITVAFIVFGAYCFFSMRREFFPYVELETIAVRVPYPGASPEEVEEGICQKIEEAVHSIDGIYKFTSVAQEGMGTVTMELVADVTRGDVQRILGEVRSAVDQIPSFPELAEQPQVQVPTLLTHCSRRVTAMERIFGSKVTDHHFDLPRDKQRLARWLAQALVAKPIFARTDQAMFHGDPHAGNLFLTEDGRLALLDWSLVGTLSASERVAIVQILLCAVTLDERRMARILGQLANASNFDQQRVAALTSVWVRRVRHGQFPGLSWLVGLLDAAVQDAGLRFPVNMMLFRKSLHTLDGVISDVGGLASQMERTLNAEFIRQFVMEWPERSWHLPYCRDYATRLSNFDLGRTLFGLPLTMARFWTGNAIDILKVGTRCW